MCGSGQLKSTHEVRDLEGFTLLPPVTTASFMFNLSANEDAKSKAMRRMIDKTCLDPIKE